MMNIVSDVAVQADTICFLAIFRGSRAKLFARRGDLTAPSVLGDIRRLLIGQNFGAAKPGTIGYRPTGRLAGTAARTGADGPRSHERRGRPLTCTRNRVSPGGCSSVPSRIRPEPVANISTVRTAAAATSWSAPPAPTPARPRPCRRADYRPGV